MYALGHKVLRTEGHWLAAVLACGPNAMLSHTTAAALWEMRPKPAGRIHVTTTRGGRKAPKGVVLHTTTKPDKTTHRGIPVTTPMRTLAFQEDRRRDADHLAAGYRTLRFTHHQVTERPAWVAEIVRTALRQPSR